MLRCRPPPALNKRNYHGSSVLMRTLNLRQLILLLSISAAVLVLANTFYTSYKTQRALLVEQTLEANHAYALKTADNVNNFLLAAQQQLAFAATDVLLAAGDPRQLQHIVERLKQQTNSFNSVLVVDTEGVALAITQPAERFLGQKLQNAGVAEALVVKKPLISQPYISVTEHLVVFLTHPIFDQQGAYLGFVGGLFTSMQTVFYPVCWVSIIMPTILTYMWSIAMGGLFIIKTVLKLAMLSITML